MNIHKKTRINKQDRQKITFPGSAYPKEISQQYTPAKHTEAVHCQRVLLVSLVRLPGTHYLTASSSSRTLVDLNSFSSLIYFALLFDILLAPLDNL